MSHYNYYRRASIDKFNNRPPFGIKKMDDATSTENKEQSTSCCNNCEKIYMNTAAKSYINVAKYLEQFGDKYQNCIDNKTKNIIPKIIESFQKVGQKKFSKSVKSKKKSESLETLFRNDKHTVGKILPNHKLMKDLLKNFDEENEIEKYIRVPYQQIDMIPSKDVSTYPSESIIGNNLSIRVDKGTSTTGLQWPVLQNEVEKCHISSDHSKCHIANNHFRKMKARIPQKKELCLNNSSQQLRYYVDGKKSSGSSDLEYFPIKENPLRNAALASKIPLQISKMTNNLHKIVMDKEFPSYKYNINQENLNNESTYVLYTDKLRNSDGKTEIRKKEKSFVQLQVEKLNKRNSNKNNHCRGLTSNNNLKTAKFQNKKKNMNKHYISLMNSVRDTLPKMEGLSMSDSETHEWSDNHANPDPQVRFPKETRNAMEHLMKSFKRVPLAQYVRNQNLDIQPAITVPVTSHVEYVDCKTMYSGMCHKKLSSLACSKNVCQRNCHDGAYSRLETIPPRYVNNRLRLKQKVS